MFTHLRILASFLLFACACTGTDTGNPPRALLDFDGSACKSELPAASSSALFRSAIEPSSLDSADYTGLGCFLWQRISDQELSISYVNYEEGCGSSENWGPRVDARDDGGLDLVLEEGPACSSAGCGWCTYDVTFKVRIAADQALLPVRLYHDECGAVEHEKFATLPLGEQASGALCGYSAKYATEEHALKTDTMGALRMPCRDEIPEGETEPVLACDSGLLCTSIADDEQRCLPTCEEDSDCALPSLLRCIEGTCQLATQP